MYYPFLVVFYFIKCEYVKSRHYVSVRMHVFAARVGLVHIGVFILLLLSGERNFGVRLNKPYCVRVPMDISVFAGTHADLLIVVR